MNDMNVVKHAGPSSTTMTAPLWSSSAPPPSVASPMCVTFSQPLVETIFDVPTFPDLPLLLAGAAALEEVRPGVHGGAPVARAHAQHQELGLQDQQEGELTRFIQEMIAPLLLACKMSLDCSSSGSTD